jgi:hypothetical protein
MRRLLTSETYPVAVNTAAKYPSGVDGLVLEGTLSTKTFYRMTSVLRKCVWNTDEEIDAQWARDDLDAMTTMVLVFQRLRLRLHSLLPLWNLCFRLRRARAVALQRYAEVAVGNALPRTAAALDPLGTMQELRPYVSTLLHDRVVETMAEVDGDLLTRYATVTSVQRQLQVKLVAAYYDANICRVMYAITLRMNLASNHALVEYGETGCPYGTSMLERMMDRRNVYPLVTDEIFGYADLVPIPIGLLRQSMWAAMMQDTMVPYFRFVGRVWTSTAPVAKHLPSTVEPIWGRLANPPFPVLDETWEVLVDCDAYCAEYYPLVHVPETPNYPSTVGVYPPFDVPYLLDSVTSVMQVQGALSMLLWSLGC